MVDPRNGKGSFKKFATHESGILNAAVPLGASQAAKPAPIVGTPAHKPDIQPAPRVDKTLPTTPADTKTTVRR
jgi:hypothetical protein